MRIYVVLLKNLHSTSRKYGKLKICAKGDKAPLILKHKQNDKIAHPMQALGVPDLFASRRQLLFRGSRSCLSYYSDHTLLVFDLSTLAWNATPSHQRGYGGFMTHAWGLIWKRQQECLQLFRPKWRGPCHLKHSRFETRVTQTMPRMHGSIYQHHRHPMPTMRQTTNLILARAYAPSVM